MRPTLRLWPWSSFHGTVMFLYTPWGGISHTLTYKHTQRGPNWRRSVPETNHLSLNPQRTANRERHLKEIAWNCFFSSLSTVICSEHLPGQSWGMWGMTSSSFLKAIKWSPCCNMLKSHENDNTSVNRTENGLCVRSGVQTVVSSEQEAMQQSLKGFHLMSNTLPLWPDTRGCWGSTLPVWQNLKHKTWTLGKITIFFLLEKKVKPLISCSLHCGMRNPSPHISCYE